MFSGDHSLTPKAPGIVDRLVHKLHPNHQTAEGLKLHNMARASGVTLPDIMLGSRLTGELNRSNWGLVPQWPNIIDGMASDGMPDGFLVTLYANSRANTALVSINPEHPEAATITVSSNPNTASVEQATQTAALSFWRAMKTMKELNDPILRGDHKAALQDRLTAIKHHRLAAGIASGATHIVLGIGSYEGIVPPVVAYPLHAAGYGLTLWNIHAGHTANTIASQGILPLATAAARVGTAELARDYQPFAYYRIGEENPATAK
jgi:hypothetical protein